MKKTLTILSLFAIIAFIPLLASAQTTPPLPVSLFPTPQMAQGHCPSDVVVWFNVKKGVYHLPNSPKFGVGNKQNNSFACQQEVLATGAHPARH